MEDTVGDKHQPEKGGPVRIALTGRISSGKSTALDMFARRGAAVLSTDAVVHELLEEDAVRRRVSSALGIEAASGGEGRKALADAVFNDESQLAKLQRTLFPLVASRVEGWFGDQARGGATVAVVEVPMLMEAGMEEMFDYLVLIKAPEKVRLERCVRAMGPREFQRRNARQMPDEEREPRCHAVYENAGSLEDLDSFVGSVMEMAGAGGS